MSRHSIAVLIALLALPASSLLAQEEDPGPRLEVGAHGGAIRFDDGGTNPTAGGRATVRFGNGMGIGATAHWTRRSFDLPDGSSEDATTWLYDVEGSWAVPSESRANFVVSLGIGAARFEPGESAEAAGAEAETEVSIPLGLGYQWYDYDGDHHWGLRLDLRDYIILLDGDGETDDAVTNNYQLSFGLELFLGATP